jgi:hypothetical protein
MYAKTGTCPGLSILTIKPSREMVGGRVTQNNSLTSIGSVEEVAKITGYLINFPRHLLIEP